MFDSEEKRKFTKMAVSMGNDISNYNTIIKLFKNKNLEKIYNQTVQNQNNWLFTSNMWFISRQNSNLIDNYYLKSDGTIDSDNVKNLKNIKPTFYLSGSVKYISGTGTNSDPYIVG